MPVFVNTQQKEWIIQNKHKLIYRHLLDCYYRLLNKESISTIIKSHSSFISKLQLPGHYKNYKTLALLVHYKNTLNKSNAMTTLVNSLNNKNIFTMFLTEEEKKEKHWRNKGLGKTC